MNKLNNTKNNVEITKKYICEMRAKPWREITAMSTISKKNLIFHTNGGHSSNISYYHLNLECSVNLNFEVFQFKSTETCAVIFPQYIIFTNCRSL